MSVHRSGISIILADLDSQRRSRDVHAVELDVNLVDAILTGHEAH